MDNSFFSDNSDEFDLNELLPDGILPSPVASPTPAPATATNEIVEEQETAAATDNEQQQQVPEVGEQPQPQIVVAATAAPSAPMVAQLQFLFSGPDGVLCTQDGRAVTFVVENKPSPPQPMTDEPTEKYVWELNPHSPGISKEESRRRRKAATDHQNRVMKKQKLEEADQLRADNAALQMKNRQLQQRLDELMLQQQEERHQLRTENAALQRQYMLLQKRLDEVMQQEQRQQQALHDLEELRKEFRALQEEHEVYINKMRRNQDNAPQD